MEEYVGCKVDINREKASMKITQPMLLQSFKDEFDLSDKANNTPKEPGQVLHESKEEEILGEDEQTKYRSGVRKLKFLTNKLPKVKVGLWGSTSHNISKKDLLLSLIHI